MGLRIIKSALAAIIAMYAAERLGIHSPANTGLLAILGVEVTRRRGIRSAFNRITASLFALGAGSAIFWICGFYPWAVGLFVLLVFTVLHRMGNREGIVTGTVIVFHLIGYQSADPSVILDEIKMLAVGLGTATLINLSYMPKEHESMHSLKVGIETHFSDILSHIARHLREKSSSWDYTELLEVKKEIRRGVALANRDLENALPLSGNSYWREYFYRREKQLESMQRMTRLADQVSQAVPQGLLLAEIFEQLSIAVKNNIKLDAAEKELMKLDWQYKKQPLPESRVEFEQRSSILQLDRELMHYFVISRTQHSADE